MNKFQMKMIYRHDCADYVDRRRAELQAALEAGAENDEARIIQDALKRLPAPPSKERE